MRPWDMTETRRCLLQTQVVKDSHVLILDMWVVAPSNWNHIHYLIKSIWTPIRNCNATFPVTHFPAVDINTGWAHPLPL
jgi:hypothetical protein